MDFFCQKISKNEIFSKIWLYRAITFLFLDISYRFFFSWYCKFYWQSIKKHANKIGKLLTEILAKLQGKVGEKIKNSNFAYRQKRKYGIKFLKMYIFRWFFFKVLYFDIRNNNQTRHVEISNGESLNSQKIHQKSPKMGFFTFSPISSIWKAALGIPFAVDFVTP